MQNGEHFFSCVVPTIKSSLSFTRPTCPSILIHENICLSHVLWHHPTQSATSVPLNQRYVCVCVCGGGGGGGGGCSLPLATPPLTGNSETELQHCYCSHFTGQGAWDLFSSSAVLIVSPLSSDIEEPLWHGCTGCGD